MFRPVVFLNPFTREKRLLKYFVQFFEPGLGRLFLCRVNCPVSAGIVMKLQHHPAGKLELALQKKVGFSLFNPRLLQELQLALAVALSQLSIFLVEGIYLAVIFRPVAAVSPDVLRWGEFKFFLKAHAEILQVAEAYLVSNLGDVQVAAQKQFSSLVKPDFADQFIGGISYSSLQLAV